MDSENQFTFNTDSIEIKTEDGNDYVIGYASTEDLDLVNDIVTKACMEDMSAQMDERNIKLDIEHEAWRGDQYSKTIPPAMRIVKNTIDEKGLLIKALLNPNYVRMDAKGTIIRDSSTIKADIKNKFLDAFSIAYIPVSAKHIKREGKTIRMLDKVNLMNVALTGNPVNQYATMTEVMMKSRDFLDTHTGDNMTTETNEENTIDVEAQLKAVCERLEKLEKKDEEATPEPAEAAEPEATPEPEPEAEAKPAEETAEVKALRSEVDELKAFLNEPQYKSVVENMKEKLADIKSKDINPLDSL